jgi:hypothetical protein
MNKFKERAALLYFWLPFAVVFFLNIGRNGHNLPEFGPIKLSLLALCGLVFAFFPFATVASERFRVSVCSTEPATWRTYQLMVASALGGLLCLWLAIPRLFQAW